MESSLEAKSMSSQIDSYSGQEKFLYEYASFLFERVENDPLNTGGEIPKSFCNWCSANDAIAVNSRRNVHEMSGKMIHFISTLLAEKIELCEVGSRSSRSFGAFDMISDKEGKTLSANVYSAVEVLSGKLAATKSAGGIDTFDFNSLELLNPLTTTNSIATE